MPAPPWPNVQSDLLPLRHEMEEEYPFRVDSWIFLQWNKRHLDLIGISAGSIAVFQQWDSCLLFSFSFPKHSDLTIALTRHSLMDRKQIQIHLLEQLWEASRYLSLVDIFPHLPSSILENVSFRAQATLIAEDIIHHFMWRPSSVRVDTHSAPACGLREGETPSDSVG